MEKQQAEELFGHFATQVLATKLDSLPGVQQANGCTLEREIGYLFQTCTSLDALCIPQNKHHHWAFCAIIYTQKFGFSDSPQWWLVGIFCTDYVTPADTSACSGEESAPGHKWCGFQYYNEHIQV